MALSFSFDTSKGETPESVASRRKSADALAARIFGRTPQNVGEGLNALGQAFIARQMTDEANAAQSAGQASASAAFNPIASAIMGQYGSPAAAPVASAPMGGLPAMPSQSGAVVQDDGNAAPGTVGMNQRLADLSYDFIDDNPGTSLSSGHRSTADQARLFADRGNNPNPVAPPGTSNHERGNAVDIAGMSPATRSMLPQYGLGQPVPNDPPHVELARPTMLASADDGAELPVNAAPAQGMLPTAEAVRGAPTSLAPPVPMRSAGPTMQQLMAAQNNPWLTDGQRSMINVIYKQRVEEEAQARDPLRQGQISMLPIEREGKVLANDKARRDLQPVGEPYKDDDGNLVQKDSGGKVNVLSAAEKAPTSVQEYKYYLSTLPPGEKPLQYNEWTITKARAASATINNAPNFGGGSDKQIFDSFAENTKEARAAATGLTALRTARQALQGPGGAITGFGADERLTLQKVGAAIGVADPSKIENTETFRAAIAPQVSSVLKSTVGTANISNSDREFAEKAAGGSIKLDARSINRLLNIMEEAGKARLMLHQEQLDSVYPDAEKYKRERALFGVKMPEAPAASQVDDLLKKYGNK